MAKYILKTQKKKRSVQAFLNSVKDPICRADCKKMLLLIKEITNEKPVMWGDSIVGFGDCHYKYASGHEGDLFIIGFSPRKQALTIYSMSGYKNFGDLLKKLGPHKIGKSCLYIKRLEDIHEAMLRKIITLGYKDTKKRYPE